MTNREYIISKLNAGKTIWRYTKSHAISYTKSNNGVWRVSHHDCGSCTDKTISMQTAIDQLLRNFGQIYKI